MNQASDFNQLVLNYQNKLADGKIQEAYHKIVQYMMKLKADLIKNQSSFKFGNLSMGYLDYTYFPITNTKLSEEKLRFGIVFNHKELRFELWLMGKNRDIQQNYWHLLKTSQWNEGVVAMPQYSVLESIIVTKPNFNDLDGLTQEIEKKTFVEIEEILHYLLLV